jgi:DNA-binding NarL/FixJ family response regulator
VAGAGGPLFALAPLDGTLTVSSPPSGPTVVRGAAVRVVICEDLALLRDGLKRLLQDNGMEVVAVVADGDRLVSAAFGHKPDVCVVDVRLPPTFRDEGLRAALAARERIPGLPVLILSQHVEQTYAAELLADGVGGIGYLLKDRVGDVDDLAAVRRVAGGGTVLDPEVVVQILVRWRSSAIDSLTPREREVLALMAEGRSDQAIAEALVVTPGAVEKHVSSIFSKLELPASDEHNRRVLAVLAYLRSAH